jgi:hypothetical protein
MRFIITILAAGLLFGQEKPAEPKPEPSEAAVIQVKTLSGDSFDRLMRLLNVFGAKVQGDSEMRTIVVYAPKNVVEQMRHVVEQLDKPGSQAALGQNIEMTMTLLRCTATPATGATPLPADIEQVAKQLRAATQCKNAEIWDILPMRLQEGKRASGQLQLPGTGQGGQHALMSVTVSPEAVYRREQNRYVRFSMVKLDFKIPIPNSFVDAGINTSGDFMEGQKTVLGKVSGTGNDESIFAVIALKVLD